MSSDTGEGHMLICFRLVSMSSFDLVFLSRPD